MTNPRDSPPKSPAEKLAERKPWRRAPRNTVTGVRRRKVWNCGLRKERERLRISLRDVAKAVGMSINALWHVENGTDPQLTTATKLAAFYGKEIWELWTKR